MLRLQLPQPQDTVRLAKALAGVLTGNETIALSGPLGAGKTFLTRELCLALGVKESVSSPSYVLLHEYDAPGFSVFHFDLYRLENEEEAWELGLRELFGRGLMIIEWPRVAERLLPPNSVHIDFDYEGEGRRAAVRAPAETVEKLEAFWGASR